MQIPPTSWTNPAAATQQAMSTQKGAGTGGAESTASRIIQGVEHSEKTGDRDADERYDGPNPQSRSDSRSSDGASNSQDELSISNLTELPADDGQISQIDLQG